MTYYTKQDHARYNRIYNGQIAQGTAPSLANLIASSITEEYQGKTDKFYFNLVVCSIVLIILYFASPSLSHLLP